MSDTQNSATCPPTRAGRQRCPHVDCRHHMAVDVTDAGSLKHMGETLAVSAPSEDGEAFTDTVAGWLTADKAHPTDGHCLLEIVNARPDGMTLQETAVAFGLTRERIRQIEAGALRSLRARMGSMEFIALAENIGIDRVVAIELAKSARRFKQLHTTKSPVQRYRSAHRAVGHG